MEQPLVFHVHKIYAGTQGIITFLGVYVLVYSWLYRLKPSVGHEDFKPYTGNPFISAKELVHLPNQLRWDPFNLPEPCTKVDFVDGLVLIASAGSPAMRNGLNVLNYSFNSSMNQRAFYNSDGDFLIGKSILA